MRFLIEWFIYALAIGITTYLLPGVSIASVTTTLLVALVLGLLNGIIKPLLNILMLPLTIMSLGLSSLLLNAFFVFLAARLVEGFSVSSYGWALVFCILLTIVHGLIRMVSAFVPR